MIQIKNSLFKNTLTAIFILYLLFDITHSFVQHKQLPLDGDMATIIIPNEAYSKVLDNPFGFECFIKDTSYAATNRFFAHWSMSKYFKSVPFIFQKVSSPIESIYLSCALAKTLIQYSIVFILALYIIGSKKFKWFDFLLATTLISPLFQTFGYNGLMGIIDHSITYTFFYPLAFISILIFFLPFYNHYYHTSNVSFSSAKILSLLCILLIISFNGPLNPAITIIICTIGLILLGKKEYCEIKDQPLFKKIIKSIVSIPIPVLILFISAIIISTYSFILGGYNSENTWNEIPLLKRYARLPLGLYENLTQKLGPSLLLVMILINSLLLKWLTEDKSTLKLLKLIGVFSLIYILLLPLGGYRDYRPNIIRRDTILPIYISLFLYFGTSSYNLLVLLKPKLKPYYSVFLLLINLIYINADIDFQRLNNCEKSALLNISNSKEDVVTLSQDCNVMSWRKLESPVESRWNSSLLLFWGVIDKEKYYFHSK